MSKESNDFLNILDKLRYSFVKELKSSGTVYIDFQHPSIRDILLESLKNDPKIRIQYINNLSVKGISPIIEGLSNQVSKFSDTIHSLKIENSAELELLYKRLEFILKSDISYLDLTTIIYSALVLIPRGNKNVAVKPAEIDIFEFSSSHCGKIIELLLIELSKESFYLQHKHFSGDMWDSILANYYYLSSYSLFNGNIQYIRNLTNSIIDSKDYAVIVEYLSKISEYNKILFNQVYTDSLEILLINYINEKFDELSSKLTDLENPDLIYSPGGASEYEEFDTELSHLEYIQELFNSYSNSKVKMNLRSLRERYNDINPPREESDDDYYSQDSNEEDFWTIERLFEDL